MISVKANCINIFKMCFFFCIRYIIWGKIVNSVLPILDYVGTVDPKIFHRTFLHYTIIIAPRRTVIKDLGMRHNIS